MIQVMMPTTANRWKNHPLTCHTINPNVIWGYSFHTYDPLDLVPSLGSITGPVRSVSETLSPTLTAIDWSTLIRFKRHGIRITASTTLYRPTFNFTNSTFTSPSCFALKRTYSITWSRKPGGSSLWRAPSRSFRVYVNLSELWETNMPHMQFSKTAHIS